MVSQIIGNLIVWSKDFSTKNKEKHHSLTPGSKVHGANMGTTWVLSAPDGPHVGPVNLAIRDITKLLAFFMGIHWSPVYPHTPYLQYYHHPKQVLMSIGEYKY